MGSHPNDLSLSVVMPVHNAMPHVDDAVRSILDQSHRDFEFVILDDGSTDGSTERLREWSRLDRRIRLSESKTNLGPVGSSKAVVEIASGKVIARMDADDISLPHRLERQLQLLRDRPDVGLVACVCDVIDAEGRLVRGPDVWRLGRRSWFAPFAHGSAMFRREVFQAVGGYRESCAFFEDQDLFARIVAFSDSKVVTLAETLYRVRYSRVSTRVASDQRKVERAVDLMYRTVDRLSKGETYDDLLSGTKPDALDPRVFIATGSLDLWANGKPRLVKRLFKEARLGPNLRLVSAVVWTGWASLHPPSLRLFMKTLVGLRNLSSRDRRGAVQWLPPGLASLRRQEFEVDRGADEVH